jgi:hypothetical protein
MDHFGEAGGPQAILWVQHGLAEFDSKNRVAALT